MIYLDNAATSYPKPETVYSAMDKANRTMAFNAGRGAYRMAQKAADTIVETKKLLLNYINAPYDSKVVFCPSITIALNQVLNGIEFINGDNIYVSPYEHNAVARTLNRISKQVSVNILEMPIKENTLEIDLEKLKYKFISNPPKCVCSTHVSNVTGYVLPVKAIFEAAKKYKAITVLDTAQSLGIVDINFDGEVDFLAFAGHKALYGPMGIGGFVEYNSLNLNEFITGGTGSDSLNLEMPSSIPGKYEASSPNIVAIEGLKMALIEKGKNDDYDTEKELLKYLVTKLRAIKEVELYLPKEEEHISMVSFTFGRYKSDDISMVLDQDFDIATRAGYHCAPYIHKWLKDEQNSGTIRVSLSKYNTQEDIDKLVIAIEELCE